MSKYTPEQLKFMAREALDAKARGDMRYLDLTIRLVMRTGLSAEEVDRRIEEMAEEVPA